MKTKEIQMMIGKTKVLEGHSPVCQNISSIMYLDSTEFDVMSLSKSGFLYDFEVKISRADFKKDAQKKKHLFYKEHNKLQLQHRVPNYFYYVCPENLISVEEIPKYAGLIYATEHGLFCIKTAPRLHIYKHDKMKILNKVAQVYSEREFLGMCKLTYINKEIKEKNKKLNNPFLV